MDYVKYDGYNIEPIYIFLLDSGGISKSHLGIKIYSAIWKTFLYDCKSQKKTRDHLLGPTGISTVSTCWITIHSGLGIILGPKLLDLNEKSKAALRYRLPELKLLITNLEIFTYKHTFAFSFKFSGLASTTCSQRKTFTRKQLLGLQSCHLFKYAELTEAVRQNHQLFIKLLNKVWVGKIDDNVEKLFKAIFIHESDESYATGEQGIMQTKMEVGIRFWGPN